MIPMGGKGLKILMEETELMIHMGERELMIPMGGEGLAILMEEPITHMTDDLQSKISPVCSVIYFSIKFRLAAEYPGLFTSQLKVCEQCLAVLAKLFVPPSIYVANKLYFNFNVLSYLSFVTFKYQIIYVTFLCSLPLFVPMTTFQVNFCH